MMFRPRSLVALAAVVASLASVTPARADDIGAGQGSYGHVTGIGKGVKELGIEALVVASSQSLAESKTGAGDQSSSLQLALNGGAVFRYFAARNFAAGLHVGGLYGLQKQKTGGTETLNAQNSAFIFTIGADYFASLSRGMFLVPGVSLGGFLGSTKVTTPAVGTLPETTTRYGQSGMAIRAGLGLSFYASSHFKLSARPEALIMIGSTKLKEQGGQSVTDAPSRHFTSIDGGFNVGMSYVF